MASLRVLQPIRTGTTSAPSMLHPDDVQRLPPGVLLAHVDDALKAEERASGRGRHAVLARAGFRDHPALAHPAGEKGLPEHIVDLVGAGVREILTLEQDPAAARVRGETRRLGERSRPARVGAEEMIKLGLELLVRLRVTVGGG